MAEIPDRDISQMAPIQPIKLHHMFYSPSLFAKFPKVALIPHSIIVSEDPSEECPKEFEQLCRGWLDNWLFDDKPLVDHAFVHEKALYPATTGNVFLRCKTTDHEGTVLDEYPVFHRNDDKKDRDALNFLDVLCRVLGLVSTNCILVAHNRYQEYLISTATPRLGSQDPITKGILGVGMEFKEVEVVNGEVFLNVNISIVCRLKIR